MERRRDRQTTKPLADLRSLADIGLSRARERARDSSWRTLNRLYVELECGTAASRSRAVRNFIKRSTEKPWR